MKKNIHIIFVIIFAFFMGCEDEKATQQTPSGNLYIVCEGNYGVANASLWSLDLEDENADVNPNIYEALTGHNLGDVANAMVINQDQLFIINNNSHSLEIMTLGNHINYLSSIDLAMSSPRYIDFDSHFGYISTWYNGILVMDLNSNSISDTIAIDGMAEDVIYHQGYLYVSVPLKNDWSTNDDVLKIDIASKTVVDTFNVIPGPGRLLISNNTLVVASTYYDPDWNTFAGNSSIDLSTGIVLKKDYGMTFDYSSDLVEINGTVYRATTSGVVPLSSDLTPDTTGEIGNFTGVYSVSVIGNKIVFGVTDDYTAPDQVFITDLTGFLLRTIDVGALPTDFVIYNK